MSEGPVERRLAAIMAADVVGYSRLMGTDEEGTLAALKAIRRELGDPKIAEHRGRIVKTTGDGLLVEFASVVDAVRCAVEMQQGMARRNANVPVDKHIEFRFGIHQGDIIIDDGDIFGDGVNLAARLEGLAEPGGICVSRVVRDEIRDKLELAFNDMGEQSLKNMARPIRVFAVNIGMQASRPPATETGAIRSTAEPAPLALPDKPSLAVLPFQNMSGDPEQEYFVDGMVEEIITALSRIRWLFVIARNSSFTYKGQAVDVKRVGRELGVRYLLEGSVRKAGNQVRITGQLIDTATATHIWADRFDGALDDIFALQDEVAANVAGAIEPKLRLAEIQRVAHKPTTSLDAYDLYLRGHALFYKRTEEAAAEAVTLFKRALILDPDFALAAAMIGACYTLPHATLSLQDIDAAVRLAREAIGQGRDDPDALAWAAWTLQLWAGEHSLATSVVERALALNPNSAVVWDVYGWISACLNRPDNAIAAFRRAMRLSPMDPIAFAFAAGMGMAHLAAKQFDEAIDWADRALHDQPRFLTALRIKLVATAYLGQHSSKEFLRQLIQLKPGSTIRQVREEVALAYAPDLWEFYEEGLRLAGLPE
jgi:adenylate cyclase